MPDLREWIEAQLKKGYSASQIKDALSRRGYPSRAVAEVNRIASSYSSQRNPLKKPVPNKFVLTILIIMVIIVAWLLAAPFLSKQPAGNIIPEQKSDEQAKQDEAQHVGMCSKFTKVEGEVECKDAIKLVMEKYPGEVKHVDKKDVQVEIGKRAQAVTKYAWVIGVSLNEPIAAPSGIEKDVEVAIDVYTKDVLYLRIGVET